MKAFIIFRDRVTYARRCLAALQAAGFEPYVVDHDSTWPAARAWLMELEAAGVPVLRRGANAYPWQLWEWEPFQAALWGDEQPYLVTDPDVVPADGCPPDWPQHLVRLLERHGAVKAGLGLRLDGPIHLSRRAEVEAWEGRFWEDELAPGACLANIDTTLAICRPWTQYPLFALGPAVRTGHPYVADHLFWYEDPGNLSPELAYYHDHADPGHHVTGRALRW